MELFNTFGSLVSILGALFALMAWIKAHTIEKALRHERERQNKKVVITLQHGSEKLELPVELRRAELTRAEILGRIGMIPMKEAGKRFSIGYLNTPEFLQQISQIMTGDGDSVLTIPCKENELEQFDLTK